MANDLDGLQFDNRFLAELPVDPGTENRPRQVMGAVASRVAPADVSAPRLVGWVAEVADMLGLGDEQWPSDPEDAAAVFAGQRLVDGMDPHAACYGGHQFGNWAGQLGDGRAIALGEVVTERDGHQTLQLKGSGLTPYSRGADGLAVLRSSIREFLCSEAMHHLGVPTTRALSLVTTGDKVMRDMFYDGNVKPEPGAIVCRVAPSFIRFGNLQILAARGETEILRRLADFTVDHYFPEVAAEHRSGSVERYAEFFAEVCRTTLDMVIHWMRVGFVHGVMNTDNMSIHGLTIDYGPYGWLEDFDPGWTPNTTDAAHRRYRYGQQPQVAQWNLLQLANALVPLIEVTEPLEASLVDYAERYKVDYSAMWRHKLGLPSGIDDAHRERADQLLDELFPLLVATETDMTLFFRHLADVAADLDPTRTSTPMSDHELVAPLADAYYLPEGRASVAEATAGWLRGYLALVADLGLGDTERREAMNSVNPLYVLRNYQAQLVIDAAENDDVDPIMDLLDVLRRPYTEQPGAERYAERRPDWARTRAGCSMLSCSS